MLNKNNKSGAHNRVNLQKKSKRNTVNPKYKQNSSLSSLNKKSKINFSFSAKQLRFIKILFLIIIVLVIGIIAGIIGFNIHTNSEISLPSDQTKSLVKEQQNSPTYLLFAANTQNNNNNEYDLLTITRIDYSEKNVIIISLPVDTYVTSKEGGATTLYNIAKNKGDGELIDSVSSLIDASINYFVKTNLDGIKKSVDVFNGIDVNLKSEIDNPDVLDKYLPEGRNHINGSDAIGLLNSQTKDYSNSLYLENQRIFAKGMLTSIINCDNFKLISNIDKLVGCFKTNFETNGISSFCDRLKGLSIDDINDTYLPGSVSFREGVKVYITDSTNWRQLKYNLTLGQINTQNKEATISDIVPSSFSISIQNGAGVTGAASIIAQNLTNLGYNVKKTGNAESNVYKETLIIYDNESMKNNAQAVKNSLNNGRLVQSSGRYTLSSDVLIIIGSDFKI